MSDKEYKILIVDDTEYCRDIMKEISTNLGYSSECSNDGEIALNRLKEMNEEGTLPDLVISDIQMPRKNGIELRKESLILFPNLKFLMMSATIEIYKSELKTLNVPYMSKSYKINELENKLNKILLK
tara:strand:+ start:14 stop:394 length:381 start_codon:yes stop_codon:yes gene_type:complete